MSLARDVTTVGSATLASRLLGFVRDMGIAAIAAALNAQGRVVAVALGVVAFNAVLLLALAWIALFGAAQPTAVGGILAYAIVLAGMAQLAVTGAGLWRVGTVPLRLHFGF